MIIKNKKWTIITIIIQLLATSSHASTLECTKEISLPIGPIETLEKNVKQVTSNIQNHEIKDEVENFFLNLKSVLRRNELNEYKKPKLNISRLSKEENRILNEIIERNTEIIISKRLDLKPSIPNEIYQTPSLIILNDPGEREDFIYNYKKNLKLYSGNDDKRIIQVTSAVAVGGVVGWAFRK